MGFDLQSILKEKMSEKSTTTQIAILVTEMANVAKTLENLERKMDRFYELYATKDAVTTLTARIDNLSESLQKNYVTQDKLQDTIGDTKRLVYGAVGVILSVVVLSIIGVVIRQTQ